MHAHIMPCTKHKFGKQESVISRVHKIKDRVLGYMLFGDY